GGVLPGGGTKLPVCHTARNRTRQIPRDTARARPRCQVVGTVPGVDAYVGNQFGQRRRQVLHREPYLLLWRSGRIRHRKGHQLTGAIGVVALREVGVSGERDTSFAVYEITHRFGNSFSFTGSSLRTALSQQRWQ